MVSACSVWDPVAEVDLERQQRHGPVPRSRPLRGCVLQREVDELPGRVLVGEAALGLDRLAQLPVQCLYGVGIRYERR